MDYRGLNKITIKKRYPLPLIGELLERISKAKYFTKLDVRDGYNRLRIASGKEWKTAFQCRYRLFEYTVMPFGLCNAPGTFQHYMNDTFRDFLDEFLVVYLDDMLIYSDNLKEHRKHVQKVLERLKDAGLFLKLSKCEFHMQEVEFLGFVIGINGVRMDPAKVESVTAWPTARSPHDYRHLFEGLGQQITIYLDHYNLLWFTETKVYNRRQARWAEKLAKYDFVIHFRPGTQGGKPDALSR